MKPSFQKLLSFQKQSKLSPQKIEVLHNLLFSSSLKHKINIDKLKRKLDLNTRIAEKLFIELVKAEVLDVEVIKCLECGEKITSLTK